MTDRTTQEDEIEGQKSDNNPSYNLRRPILRARIRERPLRPSLSTVRVTRLTKIRARQT